MLWNKTITLYNRYEREYEDPKTKERSKKTEWIRHEIDGCFVKRVLKEIHNGSTKSASYEYIVRVPEQENYMSPEEWYNTPNVQDCFFTLKNGDLIIVGSTYETIDEYVPGRRSNDIAEIKSNIGSLFISEIHVNTDFPYCPHYFIKG